MLFIGAICAKHSVPSFKKRRVATHVFRVVVVVLVAPKMQGNDSEHVPREIVPAVLVKTLPHSHHCPGVVTAVVRSVCQ